MVPRVVCIDGSALCLLGIQQACKDAKLIWVGGFQSIEALDPLLESEAVDVLIAEIRVGRDDILDFWHERSSLKTSVKLVVHTYDGNPTHIARAAACNIWDYVLKSQGVDRLIQACRCALDADRPSNSVMLPAKQYLNGHPCFHGSEGAVLTKRERQVLVHLALGLSNREISQSVGISMETVKEHVQNVLRKLKTKDRTAAAVWAIQNGLPPVAHLVGMKPFDGDGRG